MIKTLIRVGKDLFKSINKALNLSFPLIKYSDILSEAKRKEQTHRCAFFLLKLSNELKEKGENAFISYKQLCFLRSIKDGSCIKLDDYLVHHTEELGEFEHD